MPNSNFFQAIPTFSARLMSNRYKYFRNEAGLSRASIASAEIEDKKGAPNVSSISRIEKDNPKVTLDTKIRALEALNKERERRGFPKVSLAQVFPDGESGANGEGEFRRLREEAGIEAFDISMPDAPISKMIKELEKNDSAFTRKEKQLMLDMLNIARKQKGFPEVTYEEVFPEDGSPTNPSSETQAPTETEAPAEDEREDDPPEAD